MMQNNTNYRATGCVFLLAIYMIVNSHGQLTSAQLLSRVQLFVTPWNAAHQASLFITKSRSLLKLMSIESVMPSNHLSSSVICFSSCLQSFLAFRVISNESALHIRWPKYWSFSFSISSSNEYSGLVSCRQLDNTKID